MFACRCVFGYGYFKPQAAPKAGRVFGSTAAYFKQIGVKPRFIRKKIIVRPFILYKAHRYALHLIAAYAFFQIALPFNKKIITQAVVGAKCQLNIKAFAAKCGAAQNFMPGK